MWNANIDTFIKDYITGRRESHFHADMMSYQSLLDQEIKGKSVLVIGGAGTIGLSFIKALLPFRPARLYIVDTNENGLTEVTRDLRSTPGQYIPEEYKTYPMNFGDEVFRKLFTREGPFHIVANFAAHKHVRSEKDQYAIEAMLDNNVFKTRQLMELLKRHKPEHFFCVSTDKATNPVNVMGASKKLMEEVIMAYSEKFKVSTARFANVAFSNGSLLDGYLYRICKNQPISCPSDIKRFFVSPEESGQICLLTCLTGKSGDIMFPKLTEDKMVSFKDITYDYFKKINRPIIECSSEEEARQLSRNLQSHEPYPVYFFTSDTSGEKLFEEFTNGHDCIDLTLYQGIGVIKNSLVRKMHQIDDCISELKAILQKQDTAKADIISIIKKHIPDFMHIETGLGLDQKM
ncbi:MAG: polysaccharide biosynthesis protein [Saprospiraceae bacterium]